MQIHKGRAALVEMGAQDLGPPVLQVAHRLPRRNHSWKTLLVNVLRAGVFQAHVVILNLPRRSVPR